MVVTTTHGGLFFRRFQSVVVRRWAILFAFIFISFAGVVVHTTTTTVFFDLLRQYETPDKGGTLFFSFFLPLFSTQQEILLPAF